MLRYGILCYVANRIHNYCVMSVLLLIVGWSIGQGRYGVPADLTAWGGAPPGGNFGRPRLSSLHKGGTALNKKLLLLLAHNLLLLLFIAVCSGFAQLLVIGKTIGDSAILSV